jgi:hypothetical protein
MSSCPSRTRHQFIPSLHSSHVITHSRILFHVWNSSSAEWWRTPDCRCLYWMLWGKPLIEWCSSTELGPQVNLFLVPIFGVNICPLNYGIKGDFILELTLNAQRPQAESVQHLFFPPSNYGSLHPDPNPSSSTFSSFNPQMANQDQALQVNLILLKLIRYYLSRILSQIFLPSLVLDRP